MLFVLLSLMLTPEPPITDYTFVQWSEACEDAGGHPVQSTYDRAWDCVDDDTDGGEPVVIDLDADPLSSCAQVQACDR